MISLPDNIDKIEQAYPGATDKLFEMARVEQEHQHWVRRKNVWRSYFGLGAGLIVTLSFLGAATYLITLGKSIEGTVLGTVDLVALASVFVISALKKPEQ